MRERSRKRKVWSVNDTNRRERGTEGREKRKTNCMERQKDRKQYGKRKRKEGNALGVPKIGVPKRHENKQKQKREGRLRNGRKRRESHASPMQTRPKRKRVKKKEEKREENFSLTNMERKRKHSLTNIAALRPASKGASKEIRRQEHKERNRV
jgi:hypothetical protein